MSDEMTGAQSGVGWDLRLAYDNVPDNVLVIRILEQDLQVGTAGHNAHIGRMELDLYFVRPSKDYWAAQAWATERITKIAEACGGITPSEVVLKSYDVATRNSETATMLAKLDEALDARHAA